MVLVVLMIGLSYQCLVAGCRIVLGHLLESSKIWRLPSLLYKSCVYSILMNKHGCYKDLWVIVLMLWARINWPKIVKFNVLLLVWASFLLLFVPFEEIGDDRICCCLQRTTAFSVIAVYHSPPARSELVAWPLIIEGGLVCRSFLCRLIFPFLSKVLSSILIQIHRWMFV